jgi:hypothetical protein
MEKNLPWRRELVASHPSQEQEIIGSNTARVGIRFSGIFDIAILFFVKLF